MVIPTEGDSVKFSFTPDRLIGNDCLERVSAGTFMCYEIIEGGAKEYRVSFPLVGGNNCSYTIGVAGNDCSNTGTIFFENCDDGREFYFLRTTDGRVYDPYLGTNITYEPVDGQTIKFDFVDANFSSPCSIAEKAINITCLEIVAENENNQSAEIIDEYPFLEEEIDRLGCTTIEIFDQGSHAFIFLRLGPNNGRLYLDNGTFYCESTPTYDCLSAYNLGIPTTDWAWNEFRAIQARF